MKTVRDILRHKGTAIYSVKPDSYIYEALKLMDEKNIGAVLVLDGDRLCGIFSERDYARKVVLKGKTSRETKVSEAMTSRVACVRPEHTIEECMAVMTDKRIRHLPVLTEDDRVAGVISIGDVVQAKISEQQFLIEQLENYITGCR
jgi:CBS domain-containing protein